MTVEQRPCIRSKVPILNWAIKYMLIYGGMNCSVFIFSNMCMLAPTLLSYCKLNPYLILDNILYVHYVVATDIETTLNSHFPFRVMSSWLYRRAYSVFCLHRLLLERSWADFAVFDFWRYCKSLCDVKFRQMEGNGRTFRHRELRQ